ncbi:MAG: hypothetical protein JWN86_1787 [Planctomycetota bacterium]|nr:hypothetical protein [Planctomycetota bacterium]
MSVRDRILEAMQESEDTGQNDLAFALLTVLVALDTDKIDVLAALLRDFIPLVESGESASPTLRLPPHDR